MTDWTENMVVICFGLLSAFLVYIVVRMIANRIRGRDELEDLFSFRIKKNKNKS